jgi:Uma2 family endonuclease
LKANPATGYDESVHREESAMSVAAVPPPPAPAGLMSVAEFLRRHGDESGIELVHGRIVRLPMPGFRHGRVCFRAGRIIGDFVVDNGLGHIATNDSFIVTRTNPPGVRGADLIYISFATLPQHQEPIGAISPPLELVVEVRSPSDSMADLETKAIEYLAAGVQVVLALDPDTDTAVVFRPNQPGVPFSATATLTLPDVLPGFAVPVADFFG